MRPLPQPLLEQLAGVSGFDRNAFVDAHAHSAVTSVRLHPEKVIRSRPVGDPVPWCNGGIYLPERPVFTLDPSFHAGGYYVQEASSMFLDYLVRSLLPERTNLRVLDLCAAPGGKSTLLASWLDPSSLLISNEVIRTRASILEENVVRWGYTNHWVSCNDPRDFSRLEGYFDLIVVDAPCSGSGLFRKDERALDEWSEANVSLCSQRQQRILADAWPALKEGGVLVYATCSYSPDEDEGVLDWLADQFEVISATVDCPSEWNVVNVRSGNGLSGYRFFPHRLKGEGFFIAAVTKIEATEPVTYPKAKTIHDKKISAQAAFLLDDGQTCTIWKDRDEYRAVSENHEADLQLLSKMLYLRKAGLGLGMPANKDWVPSHEVALSLGRSKSLPVLEVTKEQALRFLKKEEMNLVPPEKGWVLISYEGLSLGWIKSLGNRINNYLPKHWRIRMELPSEWD